MNAPRVIAAVRARSAACGRIFLSCFVLITLQNMTTTCIMHIYEILSFPYYRGEVGDRSVEVFSACICPRLTSLHVPLTKVWISAAGNIHIRRTAPAPARTSTSTSRDRCRSGSKARGSSGVSCISKGRAGLVSGPS